MAAAAADVGDDLLVFVLWNKREESFKGERRRARAYKLVTNSHAVLGSASPHAEIYSIDDVENRM